MVESRLDPGRGPVTGVLVQRGTLRIGDAVVAGPVWGKVRAMLDDKGERVEEATPGMPVEVLGFDGVCEAGEHVQVVENERRARALAQERETRLKTEQLARRQARKVTLEEVFQKASEGDLAELNIVLKADVSGSLEALQDEIAKVPQEQVAVNIIHAQTGGINESDVMLASASDAVIIGFNVRPLAEARRAAEREGVDIRTYTVIYKVTEDLRAAMEGLLEPEEVEEALGQAEVKQTFKAPASARSPAASSPTARSPAPPASASFATARSSGAARSARCAASRTTSRRSTRARSAASSSRATPTSRRATSSSSSRPSRSRRRSSSVAVAPSSS